ncbi:MAG: hypothetical protein NVS3B5_14650 [Sphingomicrobium sp.]
MATQLINSVLLDDDACEFDRIRRTNPKDMPDPLEKYRIARAAVRSLNSTSVCRDDGTALRAKVSDLSDDACILVADEHMEVGERIAIELPGMGRMKAIVRWRAGQTHGVGLVVEIGAEPIALPTENIMSMILRKSRWPQLR